MHVNRNLNTDLARKEKIDGIVEMEINFIIDKEGEVINITASGAPERINEDALRVINKLPKFEPGILNGKPVNVKYKTNVAFRVY